LKEFRARFIAEEPIFGAISLSSLRKFMKDEEIFAEDTVCNNIYDGNPLIISYNGVLTVYTEDEAGNYTIFYYTVENIDKLTSDTSAFTLSDANGRTVLHANVQYTYTDDSATITAFKEGGEVVYRGILSEGEAGNISSINVDEGIVRLNNRCFCKDTNLVNVALPNTLTYIDEGVFQQSGFKSITIPENVTFIGKQAFGACGELETIVINAKKVTIDNYVARACAKLKSVYIYSEEVEFINKSMYFTNKENADASAITFYVSSQKVADTVYEAQSTSHSYGIKIVSIDGATTYYNTLK
jgi:hypothetical protein